MSYTKQEREILDSWPTVTAQDLEAMNGLFSHYLFFSRAGDLMGLSGINLWASCCGHKEARPYLTRTQDQEHWTLMDLRHKARLTCPWCGREVTAIDLSRAKGRKSLRQTELTVLLHAKGDALYADALVLYKDYADEAALTAGPVAWCSSGYRFVQGEVMQVDHQWDDKHPRITYERGKLGRKKLVQEPFKAGSISWYNHSPYSILNREALESHPFFRYCGFFGRWQYRPGGDRGYAAKFHELISYLTAYAIYPRQIEMLSKAECWELIADLVWSRKKNVGAMCWEESDPRKAFELDGLRIVFPATAGAIRREGKVLDHCVGGCASRHMSGVCTILFLRRADDPHTPYVTIEMDGNKIRQIHGYHNDTLAGSPKPREVHKDFLAAWLRWLRAGSKRNEDGTPKLPKRRAKKKAAA